MPLEKGQAPLEKGQTYIEHFPAREDALLISHVKSIQTTYCHFDRATASGEIWLLIVLFLFHQIKGFITLIG